MEEKSTEVKNIDIPLLSNIASIMQEVTMLEKRREWTESRLINITQHISGMPGGGGNPKGLEDAFSALSALESDHEEKIKEYVGYMRHAQRIINEIESETMRAFVIMKYMLNAPDTEIRDELNLSRRAIDRAKNSIESAHSMKEVQWKERYILQYAEDE